MSPDYKGSLSSNGATAMLTIKMDLALMEKINELASQETKYNKSEMARKLIYEALHQREIEEETLNGLE